MKKICYSSQEKKKIPTCYNLPKGDWRVGLVVKRLNCSSRYLNSHPSTAIRCLTVVCNASARDINFMGICTDMNITKNENKELKK